jgi:hypothetical protein
MSTPDFPTSSRLGGDLVRRRLSSSSDETPGEDPSRGESRLRGTLAPSIGKAVVPAATEAPSSRLRMSAGLRAVAERGASSGSHAPTWELKLGNHGTGYGDLRGNGFEARNSNHCSGQDAFAVSVDRRRFAVADGLGGATDKEGTSFLARYVADAAVQNGVDLFFDTDSLTALYSRAEDEFMAQTGRRFTRPRIRSQIAGTVASTLTYAEVLDGGHARIVTIGDSPVFLMDDAGRPVAQYGEDAQSGMTDTPLAFKLGIDMQGRPIVPRRDEIVGGRRVVDTVIDVPAGYSLAIGSDYFSDTVSAGGRFGELSDFIGQTPEAFHDSTRATGKSDDATLITISPENLFA